MSEHEGMLPPVSRTKQTYQCLQRAIESAESSIEKHGLSTQFCNIHRVMADLKNDLDRLPPDDPVA